MPEQNGIGRKADGLRDDLSQAHGAKLGVEQLDFVSGIEQGTAQSQEAERRKMLVGDAAADGGVRWVKEEEFHCLCMAMHFVLQSIGPQSWLPVQEKSAVDLLSGSIQSA